MMQRISRFLGFAAMAFLLFRSVGEFQATAWGTGVWWGEYSLSWAAAYLLYFLFCLFCLFLAGLVFWRGDVAALIFDRMASIRERLGWLRWILAVIVLAFPVWFLQYTIWGIVFEQPYTRLFIWGLAFLILGFLITRGQSALSWKECMVAALLTSSSFVVAVPFQNVTDYPFSLGWSEGNRMWDYSILFGRDLYDYPADQDIPVLLDIGRQFVGGLPFIIPGLTIGMERFWIALTVLIPYLLLGFAAFNFTRSDLKLWIFATLGVLIFLKQGPIHPPLVLCAAVTALLWKKPLWLSLPLIAVTGFIAEESRFTWIFAPGMWLGMLELAGADLKNKKLTRASWVRAISLGLAGMLGGQYGQKIMGYFQGNIDIGAATSVDSVISSVSAPPEPLLWYRLLPNATYGPGIVLGLLIAIAPLVILLTYLAVTKKWNLNIWQSLAILSPLAAFLVVGLIVSTKMGGGGDLHNMDMFLIGLVFVGVIAWQKGGYDWLMNSHIEQTWVKGVILLFFLLPGYPALTDLRGHDFSNQASKLAILTDIPPAIANNERTLQRALDMIPSREVAERSLEIIQSEVDLAVSEGGDVLFLDQRQLLTFSFIQNVPFVPEYEKKRLMNEAMGEEAAYFEIFYADISKQRFSLIISEPLRTPEKDSTVVFGEENNAWVKWVSIPVLCYYEPKITLTEVNVELLVPKAVPDDCLDKMP